MKVHGIVKGRTIELDADPELPDGQRVLVELEITIPTSNPDSLSHGDFENGRSANPASENIRQARALRDRIASRQGGSLLNSVDLIREDRAR